MLEMRSPEATKRLARFAGAVYVLMGLMTALGFYHAPLLQGDLGAPSPTNYRSQTSGSGSG